MSEQAPQPQPDIFTEAIGYDSFNGWLSSIVDQRLQQLADVISQVDAQELKDEETLYITSLAWQCISRVISR